MVKSGKEGGEIMTDEQIAQELAIFYAKEYTRRCIDDDHLRDVSETSSLIYNAYSFAHHYLSEALSGDNEQ